jgi:hypothetical protein
MHPGNIFIDCLSHLQHLISTATPVRLIGTQRQDEAYLHHAEQLPGAQDI